MGLKSMLAGAAAMYLFDPDQGRRRRSLVRDKMVRLSHQLERETEVMVQDLKNRLSGVQAELRSRLQSCPVSEDKLRERIRSELGHVSSHPRAIEVEVNEGRVILSGPVLASEADLVVRRVQMTPGVESVEDQLQRIEHADTHPALQGGRARSEGQLLTTPAARLVVGTVGSALFVQGLATDRPLRTLLGLAGVGFCMAEALQPELRRTAEQLSTALEAGQQGSTTDRRRQTVAEHDGPHVRQPSASN